MTKILNLKHSLFLLTGLLALFISGCNHYYYVPNIQNVPLFREKNEFRLSAGAGGGDKSSSSEVQAAYSVTDKIGIMGNFMTATGGTVAPDKDWAKGNYFDGGIGYFRPVDKYGVFEIYGGFGVSNQDHTYAQGGTSNLHFNKIFIQPSFGFTFKAFDIAFSTRICNLNFDRVTNNINFETKSYEYNKVNSLAEQKSYLFLEPAITIRGGWKYLKVQGQFAGSSYNNRNLPFESYHVSLGIYFSVAERYSKEISKKK